VGDRARVGPARSERRASHVDRRAAPRRRAGGRRARAPRAPARPGGRPERRRGPGRRRARGHGRRADAQERRARARESGARRGARPPVAGRRPGADGMSGIATTTPDPSAPEHDGLDKAAILLLTLGADAASGILKHLTESEVRRLSQAMARVRSISRQAAARVHDEAWRWLSSRDGYLVDGEDFVRRVLSAGARPYEPQAMLAPRSESA